MSGIIAHSLLAALAEEMVGACSNATLHIATARHPCIMIQPWGRFGCHLQCIA